MHGLVKISNAIVVRPSEIQCIHDYLKPDGKIAAKIFFKNDKDPLKTDLCTEEICKMLGFAHDPNERL